MAEIPVFTLRRMCNKVNTNRLRTQYFLYTSSTTKLANSSIGSDGIQKDWENKYSLDSVLVRVS